MLSMASDKQFKHTWGKEPHTDEANYKHLHRDHSQKSAVRSTKVTSWILATQPSCVTWSYTIVEPLGLVPPLPALTLLQEILRTAASFIIVKCSFICLYNRVSQNKNNTMRIICCWSQVFYLIQWIFNKRFQGRHLDIGLKVEDVLYHIDYWR